MKHFVIIPLDEGKFESVFGRIDFKDPGLSVAIKAVDIASFDSNKVQSLVKGPDNTIVAATCQLQIFCRLRRTNLPVKEGVLDVVQGGVKEHASIIPGSTLDTDRLM